MARMRATRRWSQRHLAEQLHTDQAMVARWEKGRVVPRPETIQRLAELFQVSEADLLSDQPARLETAVEDPEMLRLLTQVRNLSDRDRETLKAVIEAMIMRSQLKLMMPQAAS